MRRLPCYHSSTFRRHENITPGLQGASLPTLYLILQDGPLDLQIPDNDQQAQELEP
jgi:hypothetical protein